MAREPGPEAPIPLLLELNRGFESGGTNGAWERLQEVWRQIGGGALKRVSEDFATGELSFDKVKELVTDDQSPDTGASTALHRVWPDFPVHPLINESAHTVKADTARRAFDSCGEKIVWAVIDSGISKEHAHFQAHPGLHAETLGGEDAEGGKIEDLHHDFTGGQSPLTDEKGHGTHVAGIIAGGLPAAFADRGKHSARVFREATDASGERGRMVEQNGIDSSGLRGMAPAAKLVSLKVIESGADEEVRDGRLLEAIQWVRDRNGTGAGFRIHGVNISIGHDFPARWYGAGYSPLCQAVDMLVRSGVVVVVAAGNSGYGILTRADEETTHTVLQATINDPGNTERAITVGSTHRTMPHSYGISYFSSKGPTGDGRYKPDLVAPGERIVSCATGKNRPAGLSDCCHAYTEGTGTSMAAPHVSGAIAAFLSSQREFIGDPDRVKKIFMESATPLGRSRYFEGAGLLDLMRALQSI
ncbi:S8 family peptidase [Streptomyces sp. NPDC059564]|uniref:S8 family peptidase n=1 Tax=Streptomyces sp. NPDC059564 TaxID=3346865 RepID=UPI0036B6EE36